MPSIKVKIDPSNNIRISSPLSLVGTGGINRLDSLLDVEEGASPQDGSVLVYRASDDKYIVTSTINLSNSTGTLDGGSF